MKNNNFPESRYEMYRKNAGRSGKDFLLTVSDFVDAWHSPCHYCGETIKTVGFDRIDNGIGYIVENIVPCCWQCNRAKGTMSEKEFIDMCRSIVKTNLNK